MAATIAGNITSLGIPTASTSYGFVYSTTASTTTALVLGGMGVTQAEVGTTGAATGAYSTTLSGLTPSTPYYYLAYASNSTGTGYGTVVRSFITAAPSITGVTVSGAPVCATAAATIDVSFTPNGTFTGTYAVQLSDAAGSFATPTTLAITGTASPLTATIPAGTASGSGYLVRVTNTAPATTSSNSAAFTIVSNPTVSIAPTATQTITAGASGTTLTATESLTAGTTRVWQFGASATGPFTSITPAQTGTTYTPSFGTPGTYFVRVLSTFAACGSVGSNVVEIDVTNPTPTISSLSPASATVNGAAFTLTVNGTNFVSGATVNFNGAALATTFVSATQLTAAVPASAITAVGNFPVTVTNPAPGATTSADAAFAVTAANPLAYYAFTGSPVGLGTPTTVAANFNATTVTRATNVTVVNPGADQFISMGYNVASAANNRYVEFTVNPATNYLATLQGIGFDVSRSGSGPDMLELRSSLNNYSTAIGGAQTFISTAQSSPFNYFFALDNTYANLASTAPVTFRIYGYNASAAGGTQRLDNLTVYGTVSTLTASPNTLNLTAAPTQSTTGTYTLSGNSLGANATVTVSSNNASVLVSTSTGGPFSQSLTLTASPTGTLSQTITVQYTSTVGSGTVTISNTSGPASAPVTVNTSTSLPITYTWLGLTTSYSSAANWAPPRALLNPTDILSFNGTTTPTPTVALDFAGTQTIGQLQFINNVNATFTTDGNRTLTLDNNLPGDDFVVAAGSTLTVRNSNTTAPSALNVALAGSDTGLVSGTLVFDGNANSNGQHTLEAAGTNAVQFASGSLFRTTATYDGATAVKPFGITTANSVVFRNGSRYEQLGGSSPFGLAQPAAVVSFEPTSYFYFAVVTNPPASPSFSGRTYGTLELNSGLAINGMGAAPTTIQGNLLVSSGTVALTQSGGLNLQGNVTVNGTATLSLAPASAGNVSFVGTTAQTIGGNSTATTPISVGANATLVVNNTAGVTLALPLPVAGTLQLTSGLLTTTATNVLTLAPGAGASGASASSFVNGPLARSIGAGVAFTADFPIGKGTAYRLLTLGGNTQGAATFTAEQREGDPGQPTNGNALLRVSKVRSFSVTSSNPTPGNFTGTITLSFGSDDGVNTPADPGFTVAKRDQPADWVNLGAVAVTASGSTGPGGAGVSGTLTSGLFSDFSEFVLASTTPNNLGNPQTNPLPVSLTRFTAVRRDGGVALTWATASEHNSARFEVERSLDGARFAKVASLAAAGTSLTPLSYATLDRTAPTQALYYRLRQVDQDGTSAYSATATVAGEATEALTLSPNPARSSVSLTTATATTYVVRSSLGQEVLRGTTQAGTATTVALPELAAGVYFFELHTSTGRLVQKLVKE